MTVTTEDKKTFFELACSFFRSIRASKKPESTGVILLATEEEKRFSDELEKLEKKGGK